MNHENHPGHPYLYSFLLVFGLTLICALLAGSSYRSEREKQEAAEQRRIQELHNEFLTQKDKAAADHMVKTENAGKSVLFSCISERISDPHHSNDCPELRALDRNDGASGHRKPRRY